MRIVIKTKNIKLSPYLRAFVNEKIRELEKFLESLLKKEDVMKNVSPRAEAFVEVAKVSRHHQKGDIFYAECQIPLPGKGIRAETKGEDLKSTIYELKDELQRQLKKYKNRGIARERRFLRVIKQKIKFFR